MLNLNKEVEVLSSKDIELRSCPVCSSYVSHLYFMQDAKSKVQSKWYSCSCGVVFQDKPPTMVYDQAYLDKYKAHDAKLKDAFEYPVRIYSPLIEELLYGRTVLLVGRPTSHQEDYFAYRGWVPTSIDKNEANSPSNRIISGDFEDYEFGDRKFSMIWMYQTLECFLDPIKALDKAKSLLTEDGILFLSSPDTDFINTRGSVSFINWKPEYNHIMWNRRSISRHLENLGFNIIMNRQNYEHRFSAWDDFHLIAQKRFF